MKLVKMKKWIEKIQGNGTQKATGALLGSEKLCLKFWLLDIKLG
jgi:hypothetical protein